MDMGRLSRQTSGLSRKDERDKMVTMSSFWSPVDGVCICVSSASHRGTSSSMLFGHWDCAPRPLSDDCRPQASPCRLEYGPCSAAMIPASATDLDHAFLSLLSIPNPVPEPGASPRPGSFLMIAQHPMIYSTSPQENYAFASRTLARRVHHSWPWPHAHSHLACTQSATHEPHAHLRMFLSQGGRSCRRFDLAESSRLPPLSIIYCIRWAFNHRPAKGLAWPPVFPKACTSSAFLPTLSLQCMCDEEKATALIQLWMFHRYFTGALTATQSEVVRLPAPPLHHSSPSIDIITPTANLLS